MPDSANVMKAALRVLTANTEKADPSPADIGALQAFAPDVSLPPDELACEVVKRAMKMQVRVRHSMAGYPWVPRRDKFRNFAGIALLRKNLCGFERSVFHAARVLIASSVGSQSNSFNSNTCLRKRASCRSASRRRLKFGITRPYPNFLFLIPWGTPSSPQCFENACARRGASVGAVAAGLVGRVALPRVGATWAKCARKAR
jgi:hypothetical protein